MHEYGWLSAKTRSLGVQRTHVNNMDFVRALIKSIEKLPSSDQYTFSVVCNTYKGGELTFIHDQEKPSIIQHQSNTIIVVTKKLGWQVIEPPYVTILCGILDTVILKMLMNIELEINENMNRDTLDNFIRDKLTTIRRIYGFLAKWYWFSVYRDTLFAPADAKLHSRDYSFWSVTFRYLYTL